MTDSLLMNRLAPETFHVMTRSTSTVVTGSTLPACHCKIEELALWPPALWLYNGIVRISCLFDFGLHTNTTSLYSDFYTWIRSGVTNLLLDLAIAEPTESSCVEYGNLETDHSYSHHSSSSPSPCFCNTGRRLLAGKPFIVRCWVERGVWTRHRGKDQRKDFKHSRSGKRNKFSQLGQRSGEKQSSIQPKERI